jgi:hypothetical protein
LTVFTCTPLIGIRRFDCIYMYTSGYKYVVIDVFLSNSIINLQPHVNIQMISCMLSRDKNAEYTRNKQNIRGVHVNTVKPSDPY